MPCCRWPRPYLLSSPGPACLPAGRIGLDISFPFPTCRHANGRGYALSHLLNLPACLPAGSPFSTLNISFSLPTCRHADGRGHVFSHLLDLPACLPAGSPFSTSNISFSFADMPSCRWPQLFLLSSVGTACLPACRPDRLFQRHFSLFPNSVLSSPVPCRHAGCWTASAEPSVSHPAPACRHARRGSHALCISSGAGMPACRTW